MSEGGTDRLKYLMNNEIRYEIVASIGGDPSRYSGTSRLRMLTKQDLNEIAAKVGVVQEEDSDSLTLEELQTLVCEQVDVEKEVAEGAALNRNSLKRIYEAVVVDSFRKKTVRVES